MGNRLSRVLPQRSRSAWRFIRKVWASHKGMSVKFEGQFYRINIPAFAHPQYAVRDRIPLYLAAVQKGMLRTTGEVADGLVGHPLYSRKYIAEYIKPNLEIGAKRAGRTDEGYRRDLSAYYVHQSQPRAGDS